MLKTIVTSSLALVLALVLARDAAAFSQPSVCPNVTCQGSPKFAPVGGHGLSHPEIVPIFWGTYWNGTSTPNRGQMIGALQQLANGPYFGALNEYGGSTGNTIGPARVAPVAPTNTTTVPSAVCSNDHTMMCVPGSGTCGTGNVCLILAAPVKAMVEAEIATLFVPPPAASTDMLYVVFVPPGSSGVDWNFSETCSVCGPTYNGQPYELAMVNGGDTIGLSHELAEAITSNWANSNCVYAQTTNAANQIADVCECYREQRMIGSSNPVWEQAYWSMAQNACVIPEGWNGIWEWNGSSWSEAYAATVRQVTAGNYGVFGTDASDNVFQVGVGSLGGGAMSMLSGGNVSLMTLSPDANTIEEYKASTGWTTIGSFTSTTITTGGSQKVASDLIGDPWAWDGSTWTMVGGPAADQFLVNNGGLVALARDHLSIWRDSSFTTDGWVQIGDGASEIFVGRQTAIALTALTSAHHVSYYPGTGTTWVSQGVGGNMFGVTLNGDLFELNAARTAVRQSSDTSMTNPPWTTLGSISAGRLVPKTDSSGNLYVTGATVF